MIYTASVENKLWNKKEDIVSILNDLENNKDNVVSLILSHHSIGEECAKELSEKIKNLSKLKKLDLSDCFVSRKKDELPKCLGYLLTAIKDKEIIELNLSDNALGPDAASGYLDFFKNNKTLKKVLINNCGMGPIGTPQLFKVLCQNKEIPLESLFFNRNKMENVGCFSVSEFIKNNQKLKEISISDNEIFKEGLVKFFESIKENKNLEYIDVHNNNISSEFKIVNDILVNLPNIKYLDLSDLTINSKEEVNKFLQSLSNMKNLNVFRFCYNLSDIDYLNEKERKAFQSIMFENLSKLENIKEIYVDNNEIFKDLYQKYNHIFIEKKIKIFECYDPEEEMPDIEDENLDETDLNK